METFWLAIFTFCVGFVLGGKMMFDRVKRIILKMHNNTPEHNFKVMAVPELVTERIDNAIMLYEKDLFLCQGKTIEDVARNFLNMQKIGLALVRHEDKEIWFVDGEVQTKLD